MNELTQTAGRQPGSGPASGSALPDAEARQRLRRRRWFYDLMARYGVTAGGVGVVIALGLIFVYLFSEVFPLFKSASVEPLQQYSLPGAPDPGTVHLAMERYNQVAARFTDDGQVVFFQVPNGKLIREERLQLAEGAVVASFGQGSVESGLVVYGLSDGSALVLGHDYDISYPGNVRTVTPKLVHPLGEAPVVLDPQGRALRAVTVQQGSAGYAVAGVTEDGRVIYGRYSSTTNFMTGEVEIKGQTYEIPGPALDATAILVNTQFRNLFVGDQQGQLHYYDISAPEQARWMQSKRVVAEDSSVTVMRFLRGAVSVIVGGADGSVSQWFLVRDAQNIHHLERVRDFEPHSAPVTEITVEHNRRSFATADEAGGLKMHYSTSDRTVLSDTIADTAVVAMTLSPVNTMMLALDANNRVHVHAVDNEHPDVSWAVLWEKVWYEGRAGEDYVWQASSGSDDFEAKFSLVPLTVGTLKAALFAMLFATPLAVMGAVYSAYFMTPKLRGVVKPTIELMEALPTVILGFLAGLWLAPFVENNLPAVFSILVLVPVVFLLFAGLWSQLPRRLRLLVPPGWEAALLVPALLLVGWACVSVSPLIEVWFFNGSMRQWFTDVGINYDQRNALVVGIAMGFAVIPTIFSIAEDAVFNVPKHLTQGSLALGATPWQTVVGVVLLTASPGIFSAVMIGFGRAVGETMIVLMATGNSPVVNFNIFEGMRTLSANIAVELPETAVNSSHFRILFLAALVLLALTFVVNTAAEIVRQRLRKKYSSL